MDDRENWRADMRRLSGKEAGAEPFGTVSNVDSRLCDEATPGRAAKIEPVGEFELKEIRWLLAAYNVWRRGTMAMGVKV